MLARTRLALGPESLLVALLGLYHVALAVGPEQPWGRGLWLAHIGLLILWQPFVETGRRLSVAELALMGAGILLLTLGLNDWLLIFWTAILSALVGGRVLFVRRRRQRIFLLLAFGYLLGALLAWQVPQVVPREMAVDPALSPVFIYALPLLLLSMLVWPRSREEAPPRRAEMVDFVYSLFVFLLLAVLVLGTLAFMLLDRSGYGVAVASTVFIMAGLLFLLAWAWDPRGGFSGFGVLFSRYVLSVALPFEQWMRRLTYHAEFEVDPERFLGQTLEEMLALPWVLGGTWAAEHRHGAFGLADGAFSQRFECPPLNVTLFTRHKLSPALMLHFHLLLRLLAEFYLAKLRGRALQQMSYIQAVHETGARLTHDVKNLLQSLTNLCHAAEQAEADDAEAFQALMQRQLPLITQRLRQALDKLEQRPAADGEEPAAGSWWTALGQRYSGEAVTFAAWHGGEQPLPAGLFDMVAENLLQNALSKAAREMDLRIEARLLPGADGAGLELQVEDSGSPVPPELAAELGRAPVSSAHGLGIGLYQAGRLAAESGYELCLAANEPGRVCFSLRPLSR